MRRHPIWIVIAAVVLGSSAARSQAPPRYSGADGRLRVALAQQPFSPTAVVPGPRTMAEGGVQQQLAALGASVRLGAAALSSDENSEYGGWKRLGMALGHFADFATRLFCHLLIRDSFQKFSNPHAAGIVRRATGWQNVIGAADFIGIHHGRILSDEERAIIA